MKKLLIAVCTLTLIVGNCARGSEAFLGKRTPLQEAGLLNIGVEDQLVELIKKNPWILLSRNELKEMEGLVQNITKNVVLKRYWTKRLEAEKAFRKIRVIVNNLRDYINEPEERIVTPKMIIENYSVIELRDLFEEPYQMIIKSKKYPRPAIRLKKRKEVFDTVMVDLNDYLLKIHEMAEKEKADIESDDDTPDNEIMDGAMSEEEEYQEYLKQSEKWRKKR